VNYSVEKQALILLFLTIQLASFVLKQTLQQMKNLFLSLSLALSCTLVAQYNHVVTAPNGNIIIQGQYTADPGLTPTDSKETIATKMAAVTQIGSWKYWTEAGVLICEEHYTTSGVRTGVWKTWTNTGVLSGEINFAAGTAVFYHPNGQKAEEGHMNTNMVRTGTWKGWHENGTLNYEGTFDSNGTKIGLWKFFDAQGNSLGTENH
jgi:antitoxin component YwqK of YwqJK toxin-antitoxin module